MTTGSSGTTTTTQVSNPWSGQQKYLTAGYQQAAQNLANPPQYYPGQAVAQFNPTQNQALGAQTLRAQQGSPVMAAADQQQTDTLNGKYLDSGNPYDSAVFKNIASQVLPTVGGQFNGAGRYGGGAMASADTTALTNAYAPYAFSNYQNERGLQQQAAGLAPTLANQDYTDISALGAAGTMEQQQQQQNINAAMQKWAYQQNLPNQQLATYDQAIAGAPGGTTTSQQPYYNPSPLSQILGGLTAGAGLFSMFSDERLKTDIRRVGKTDKGLPIYTYRYKGELGELDPGLHMGVMAQEAEKKFPEAVGEFGGYKVVDYAGLS
jgi:hypothetical protein